MSDEWQYRPLSDVAARSRGGFGATLVALVCIVVAGAALGWFVLHPSTRSHVPQAGAPIVAVSPSRAATRPALATNVAFRSTRGHFSARFTVKPETRAWQQDVNGVKIDFYLASDELTDIAVGLMDIHRTVPLNRLRAMTEGGIRGMTAGQGMVQQGTISLQHFRGHLAFAARLQSDDGAPYSVYFVRWSPTREYLFIAPAGAQFEALLTSFTPLS